METTTQELIYQVMLLVITGVLTVIGSYVKDLLVTKIDVTKYGFDNERVERIIDNAIDYAEQRGKAYAKGSSIKLASNDKLATAKVYIDKVDRDIVIKYGQTLNDMIERKVHQKFGSK